MRRLAFVVAIFLSVSILAACGNSGGLLYKHQLRTPLECPCPTLAPLAIYNLPSANSYLGGITTGPDGNVWVVESDDNKIARVSQSGTFTEFPVPTAGAYPALPTVGPDKNIWITDYNLNMIHRITPAGVITEFPLPPYDLTNGNLQVIAAGPDGNMWFTHGGANIIGVLSMSGTLLHTYPIPTPNSGVGWIVQGSDGNMWFSEDGQQPNCVNKIGRITMSGSITEFPTPTQLCVPPTSAGAFGGMTVGMDGNVWFTERFNAKIGRITTTGVITEFDVPANPSTDRLWRIMSTSDGSLWFLQSEIQSPWNAQVGKMNLSGVVTNLWSFPGGFLQGMTIGPDGSPWFTDVGNNNVVRL